MSARKDMQKLIRECEADGWTAKVRRGGHIKLTPPCGGPALFLSATPSDQRAVRTVRSQIRRWTR